MGGFQWFVTAWSDPLAVACLRGSKAMVSFPATEHSPEVVKEW
jgi:hypothetical protein